ncbi:hypothetical protein ACJJTC_010196 [Scirpophaga incertulas]
MDQKGSLVDTTIRIFPSDKLLTFLEHENFKGNIPSNVRKLLKGDYDRHTAENDFNTKQINLNLSKSDIELLSKISNKLKINQVDQSSGENIKKKIKIDKTETNKTQGNNIKLPNAIQNECLEKIKDKNLGQQFEGPYLTVFDIDWVFLYINEQRRCNKDIPYLHDLLEGCKIELPNNEIIKRNPILEARCVKLRAQQEAREYRKMTKGVDNVRMRFPEDSISYQRNSTINTLLRTCEVIKMESILNPLVQWRSVGGAEEATRLGRQPAGAAKCRR